MSDKNIKKSKLLRFLRAPIRILIRARDFYVQSLTDCSGHIGYGSVMGCPTGHINTLPRSFSASSTHSYASSHDNDLRELVRAASARSSLSVRKSQNSDLIDLRRHQTNHLQQVNLIRQSPGRLPRSFSSGIERIDEEKPCEFNSEDVKVNTNLYPRSRSYAVNRRTGFV